jgi:acetylornithine deacetylase/succinyl-diaminopimelate desuccinylase-like protein
MLLGELRVKILSEGVHSGSASGIVPSSFRILRNLMDRIEDSKTGEVLVKEAHCQIPEKHVKYAEETASTLGKSVIHFPFVRGATPISDDLRDLLLNVTWRPAFAITGVDGIPNMEIAGNVLRPETAIKLSLRLPPAVQPEPVEKALVEILTKNVPYGARATYVVEKGGAGWHAPELQPWLENSLSKASYNFYGKPVRLMGEGGSIPFMGMLGRTFPETQFVITGVLGPGSNAHGPNEFLHIQMAKNLTGCVASILADHYAARVLKQDVDFKAPKAAPSEKQPGMSSRATS